jgi:UDP-N-acetylmuramoyl-L-alanyl-D-glutamate--2,6-diaminopimelate ligase
VDLSLPPVPLTTVAVAAGGATRDARGVFVTDAACDSRRVGPGSLFFCIGGSRHDGHTFAGDALEAGAAALVVERWLPVRAPQVLVPSVRRAMGPMSAAVFGDPAADLTMLGVTGTNGKTTTTFLLGDILRHGGRRVAVIGTTGVHVDDRVDPLGFTTPEAPDLHRLLARLRHDGVGAVAMEVSSHALAFDRVGGITYDVAAFTNLSHDHLDLHGSMTSYFETKATLFTAARSRIGVVNADDPWGQQLLGTASVPIRTYGSINPADRAVTQVEAGRDGSSFLFAGLPVRIRLLGAFNVSNAACALTMAELAGVPPSVASAGVERAQPVPGRLEPIDEGQGFLVMVDYAHTPDSIQHVLRGARPLSSGKLIVVFGCGGDRDRDKRPQMGRVAVGEADLAVITTDNPRSEDPAAIIDAVVEGARDATGRWTVEPDRRAAIRSALRSAEDGDIVVIAGKGHETVQEVGERRIAFDDRQVARQELAVLLGER